MRILTAVAAAAAVLACLHASADDRSIGTEYRVTGIGCTRVEDTSRLLKELAANAPLISSRLDVLRLAERDGLSCRLLQGMDAIFAGVVDGPTFKIGGMEVEVVRLARKMGDLYTWRPAAKPGLSI